MSSEQPSLADFVRPSSFWEPMRLAFPPSWVGHIPFAYWLVDALRPGRIVELGTHSGNSYTAMCHAVDVLGLDCRCVAIDTWKGDEHAGFYDDSVYDDLFRFNAERFASFSELMRSTFDDALELFEDGSIDLLHIDGLHDYHSVRRDFENWLPKLSQRAVVIMHDTAVFERDFGVHRLWEEISGRYPSFEFRHGHGLGVLGVGPAQSASLQALFDAAADRELTGQIRNAYGRMGGAMSDRYVAQQIADIDVSLLQASVTDTSRHVANLIAQLDAATADAASSREELARSIAEVERLRSMVGPDEASYVDLKLRLWSIRDHAIGADATAGRLAAEVRALDARLSAASSAADHAQEANDALHAHLVELEKVRDHRDEMYRSRTWRIGSLITRPLGFVTRRAGK